MAKTILKPSALQPGDTIGLVSPASPTAGLVAHRLEKGIHELQRLGFDVRIGRHAKDVTGYTAGSPKDRASDINEFFADNEIQGVFSCI